MSWKSNMVRATYMYGSALVLLAGMTSLCANASGAGPNKPAPKAAAPSKPAAPAPANHAGAGGAGGAHPGGSGANNTRSNGTGGNRGEGSSGSAHNQPSVTHNPGGGTTTRNAKGAEVTKSATGRVTSVKTASGNEAKFNSKGQVKEVHAKVGNNEVKVSHGPNGARHTVVDRPDHSRLVADGHGRGYIQRNYSYGGHTYVSRNYYYNGVSYNAYYRGYYYNGVYLNGYMPAYYYPAAYYGWAYNPWAVPVAYGWGWGASPWYGYYGAYFAPYPVYPSAAFWLTDYLVAASLANAYAAAAAAGDSALLHHNTAPHLVFASYDPSTGTTSPTMTKEVKDAVSAEIKLELAAQKTQGTTDTNNVASLATLLADGQPHVFVASAGVTVTSAGQECGLTEGDVLQLKTPPVKDASTADLQVLASKKTDCAKDSMVSVEMTDLQEMHNQLLASIDKGMAEMKDHPGKGGLPAPPADATQGTKQAPYAAAAPAADPNGAAELDKEADQGAQVEKQVVAEATAPDNTGDVAESSQSPIGGLAQPAAPARPSGPVTIALGQSPTQVIASKGQPTNKVQFPNKLVYIYPDMKIVFVNNKVSDVQ